MPQAKKTKFTVLCAGTYGRINEVVALELDPESMTKRQKTMLKVYVEPEVKDLEPAKVEKTETKSDSKTVVKTGDKKEGADADSKA